MDTDIADIDFTPALEPAQSIDGRVFPATATIKLYYRKSNRDSIKSLAKEHGANIKLFDTFHEVTIS